MLKSFRRWRLLHVGPSTWAKPPERHVVALDWIPGPDALAFSTPSLLVIRSVGTSNLMPDVCGIDPLSGHVLWRFSEHFGHSPLFHCHCEQEERIVATTPQGVFLLEREQPRQILKRTLEPTSVARFSPDNSVGFVLDSNNQLLAFSKTGDIQWSRQPRSRRRFQNPFPLQDGSVCLSATEDIVRLNPQGERQWTWSGVSHDTPHANRQSRYSIGTYVVPNLLLVRSVESTSTHYLVLDTEHGEFLHSLGDIWPYGADGITHHPVVMLDAQEHVSFLQTDGSCTPSHKVKSWFGNFCPLPKDTVALYFDLLFKTIVCADARGKILWRELYPDATSGYATISFMQHTAFFATPAGQLHVWDWYPEE